MSTIPERMEAALEISGLNRAEASRRATGNPTAFRDLVDRHSSPRVETLQKFAEVFEVSVAYLIGETDDPAPSVSLRTASPDVPETVLAVNAGSVLSSLEVSISLQIEDWGEQGFLLSEPDALVLRERIDEAIRDLAAERKRRRLSSSSHPSSA